jgi:hypothetical protein
VHVRLNELDLDRCQRTPAAAPVIRGGPFGFSRNLRKRGCRAVWPNPFSSSLRAATTQLSMRTRRKLNLIPIVNVNTSHKSWLRFARRLNRPCSGPTLTNHDPIARRRRLVHPQTLASQTPEQSVTTFALWHNPRQPACQRPQRRKPSLHLHMTRARTQSPREA